MRVSVRIADQRLTWPVSDPVSFPVRYDFRETSSATRRLVTTAARFSLHFLLKCTKKGIFLLKITEKERGKPDRTNPAPEAVRPQPQRPQPLETTSHPSQKRKCDRIFS